MTKEVAQFDVYFGANGKEEGTFDTVCRRAMALPSWSSRICVMCGNATFSRLNALSHGIAMRCNSNNGEGQSPCPRP